jgi:hypothetical protein
MFTVRHIAYVDHPVAMSRAMIRASLFPREVKYVLGRIAHTCGGQIQKLTEIFSVTAMWETAQRLTASTAKPKNQN